MIGQELYKLGPRDRAGALVQLVLVNPTGLTGGVQHTFAISVPNDQVLVLKSATLTSSAGGAANILSMSIRIDSDTQIEAFLHLAFFVAPFTQGNVHRDFNDVLVGPGTRVMLNSAFTVSNAGNGSNATISGLLIPRGNLGARSLPFAGTIVP